MLGNEEGMRRVVAVELILYIFVPFRIANNVATIVDRLEALYIWGFQSCIGSGQFIYIREVFCPIIVLHCAPTKS